MTQIHPTRLVLTFFVLGASVMFVIACGNSSNPTEPASPDDTSTPSDSSSASAGKITFSSDREDDNHEIYVMNDDGTDVERLTHHLDSDRDPAWSPDGSRIAFTSTRDGNPEIYVMQADGSGLTRLSDNPARDIDPTWSADGSMIAFTSDRGPDVSNNNRIYKMNADGADVTRLTSGLEMDPAWSPDGTRIAFVSVRFIDNINNHDIYTVNVDGSGERRLTTIGYSDVEPAWSPDGTRIAYLTEHSSSGFDWDIHVMDTDGGESTLVMEEARSPTWSPDGKQLAFVASGGIKIVNVNRSGSIMDLPESVRGDAEPDWWGEAP